MPPPAVATSMMFQDMTELALVVVGVSGVVRGAA